MRGLRIVPNTVNINFTGYRLFSFAFSLALVLMSIGIIATKGLNFGIDFTGGTVIEVRVPEAPKLDDLRKKLNGLSVGNVSIQEFGSQDDLLIRLPEQKIPAGWSEKDGDLNKMAIEKIKDALGQAYEGEELDYRRTEFVGPQVGKELKIKGLYAIVFSLIGILAYIWFRFEWQYGVAAVTALAHDVIITIGLFSLTQMDFDLSTVSAILLVAGYSINDTVVVFDRIREDLRKYKKKPIEELLNLSINQTLSRTTMTSFTTILALVALYVFGGEVIRGFVDALIFGITIGTYSSIFVAAPLLMYFKINRGTGESSTVAATA